MAGYSSTPLTQKLGIKPGMRMYLYNVPTDYKELFTDFPEDVRIDAEIEQFVKYDFIHAFFTAETELHEVFPTLKAALDKQGILWISWPKRASGVTSDIVENFVIGTGLENGLVDVKVAAIDEIWSGLKFMWRLRDR